MGCVPSAAIFDEHDVQIIPDLLATYDASRARVEIGGRIGPFDVTNIRNILDGHLMLAKRLGDTSGHSIGKQLKVDNETSSLTDYNAFHSWIFLRLA